MVDLCMTVQAQQVTLLQLSLDLLPIFDSHVANAEHLATAMMEQQRRHASGVATVGASAPKQLNAPHLSPVPPALHDARVANPELMPQPPGWVKPVTPLAILAHTPALLGPRSASSSTSTPRDKTSCIVRTEW
jgi:hypothetical protein